MPAEIRDIIIQLVSENRPESANSFMEQYIRLSPNNIERYSLEAFIRFRVNNFTADWGKDTKNRNITSYRGTF